MDQQAWKGVTILIGSTDTDYHAGLEMLINNSVGNIMQKNLWVHWMKFWVSILLIIITWAERLHEMWPNKDKAVKDLVSSY